MPTPSDYQTLSDRMRAAPLPLKVALTITAGIVALSLPDLAWGQDHSRYRDACGLLLQLIEGPFGGLVTTAAGIGAIVASALGGFKTAWTLVVTAVGAFILRSYTTLFFGDSCVGRRAGAQLLEIGDALSSLLA